MIPPESTVSGGSILIGLHYKSPFYLKLFGGFVVVDECFHNRSYSIETIPNVIQVFPIHCITYFPVPDGTLSSVWNGARIGENHRIQACIRFLLQIGTSNLNKGMILDSRFQRKPN